jgi:hypothetical protein
MPEETTDAAEPGAESSAVPEQTAELEVWHALLLRMAGSVPDDLISEARTWLADGQQADVAQALAFAALTNRIPVSAADADLLTAELVADGQDTDALSDLEILDEAAILPMPWVFSPVPIESAGTDSRPPVILDLTTDPAALAALDPIDRAAVAAVEGDLNASALWRAWRGPADGSRWPAPRRVFIITVPADGNDGPTNLTVRIQEALIAAGEESPQVEVCQEERPVPAYQGTAVAHAALIWAREAPTPIQLARVFDAVDPQQGPSFDADHPRIDDPEEVERLLEYLDGALPVLTSSATMADILDPEHPSVVPLTFRTDGHWIWTDTVSYYLERYSLAPEAGLREHLRTSGPVPPPVSEVALHRVLSFLQRPDDSEEVWVVPETAGPGSQSVQV